MSRKHIVSPLLYKSEAANREASRWCTGCFPVVQSPEVDQIRTNQGFQRSQLEVKSKKLKSLSSLHCRRYDKNRTDLGSTSIRVPTAGSKSAKVNSVNRVDLCPITFASLTPIGNNRGSFCNKRHSKSPFRLEPLQNL